MSGDDQAKASLAGPSPTTVRGCLNNPWLALLPILALALGFRLYDLDAVTLVCDEPQDMPATIRHAERLNPFNLPDWLQRADPSQSRLPYYLSAVGVRLLSASGPESFWTRAGRVDVPATTGWLTLAVGVGAACLVMAVAAPPPLGRWAGLLPVGIAVLLALILGWPRFPTTQLVAARIVVGVVGTVGVWATYALGREIFDHWAGLLSAGALAVSPMHIGWSRCAVTTGDTFVAAFFTLAIWLLYRAVRHRAGRAMMGCAAAMGLAFGAKISAVLLWPVVLLYPVVLRLLRVSRADEPDPDGRNDTPQRLVWATRLHLGLLMPLAVVFLWPEVFQSDPQTGRFALWLAALAAYLLGAAVLIRSPWPLHRRDLGCVVLNLCAGGVVVAAFSTPYHLRMEVLGGLADWWRDFGARAGHKPNYALDFVSILQLLWVHARIPLDLLGFGGLIWGCRRPNRHWGSLAILVLGVYALAVTVLHQKVVYYLMPMLPLLLVVAGGATVALFRRFGRQRLKRTVALAGVLVVSLVLQIGGAIRMHPHYLLDGHRWEPFLILGPKLAPANLHFQGVRPIVNWLVENAPPGSRTGALFYPDPRARTFHSLAIAIMAFEVQRSTEVQARRLALTSVVDPKDLAACDYVILLPLHRPLQRFLSDFEEVYEARLNETPGGWLFQRRRTGAPATSPGG